MQITNAHFDLLQCWARCIPEHSENVGGVGEQALLESVKRHIGNQATVERANRTVSRGSAWVSIGRTFDANAKVDLLRRSISIFTPLRS